MQLTAMSVEDWRFWVRLWTWLIDDELTCPLVDVKAMVPEIDREWSQPIRHPISRLVVPSAEDAPSVTAK